MNFIRALIMIMNSFIIQVRNQDSGIIVPTYLTENECQHLENFGRAVLNEIKEYEMSFPTTNSFLLKNGKLHLQENKVEIKNQYITQTIGVPSFDEVTMALILRVLSNLTIPDKLEFEYANQARIVMAQPGSKNWHRDAEFGDKKGQHSWVAYLPFLGHGTEVISAPQLKERIANVRLMGTDEDPRDSKELDTLLKTFQDGIIQNSICGQATVWRRSHPDYSMRHIHRAPEEEERFGLIVTFYEKQNSEAEF